MTDVILLALSPIFGGGEEIGCNDIDYYEKKVGLPEMIFTPDGSFPVLNCEKGMVHLTFEGSISDKRISVECGTVINAIPGKAVISANSDNSKLRSTLTDIEPQLNITEKGNDLIIKGSASHGSRPERGINTATAILKALTLCDCDELKPLSEVFPHGEFNGASAGLGFSDSVSGEMTMALTLLNIDGGKLKGGLDIRFPIDRKYDEISCIIKAALENAGMTITGCEGMESHYVDERSDFIQTLLRVYEEITGKKGECISEGGITYVHNTKGGVAFGAEFPDEDNHMHGPDEHISLSTFKYNLNLYANAIAELTK